MTNPLVPSNGASNPLALSSLSEVLSLGDVLARSGFFADARTAAQAVVKMLAGRELGFQTIASMVGVHVIEGKPSIGAHLMASLIKRSGRYDYRVIRCDREACELEFLEKGQAVGRVGLTIQEATAAGLTVSEKTGQLKRNWRVSADDMLFARCISKGYRRYCPDLTGGLLTYDPDELDLTPPEPRAGGGRVVDAGYTVQNPDGSQTHVGDTETTHTPPQEAPANPPAAPQADGQGLTEQEYQELASTARRHYRTVRDVQKLLTILGVHVLQQVPRSKLAWTQYALEAGLVQTAQVDRIAKLMEQLRVNPANVSERLQELYGVSSIAHLLPAQADELETRLKAKPATSTATPTPATSPA